MMIFLVISDGKYMYHCLLSKHIQELLSFAAPSDWMFPSGAVTFSSPSRSQTMQLSVNFGWWSSRDWWSIECELHDTEWICDGSINRKGLDGSIFDCSWKDWYMGTSSCLLLLLFFLKTIRTNDYCYRSDQEVLCGTWYHYRYHSSATDLCRYSQCCWPLLQ